MNRINCGIKPYLPLRVYLKHIFYWLLFCAALLFARLMSMGVIR